ncbi:MAG: hypothetical protein FWE11_07465 [Defluviitaleaceae bacterium]|nr:hypothetical protein [Defluviitaleaceae bacterium]
MNAMYIIGIATLVLVVVPIPLVWVLSNLFPEGQSLKIRDFIIREWKRILLCGIAAVLLFAFAPEYALQVILIGAAILIGRAIAINRNK